MNCIYVIDDNSRKVQTYTQFSSNIHELEKFIALVKIIKILYHHTKSGKHTTLRDIYYQDVEIFGHNQSNCTRLLELFVEDSLQWSLGEHLNIRPSQKGMIYGDCFENFHKTTEPILIPINYQDHFIDSKTNNKRLLIIIIEKDAVFQSLCHYLKISNNKIQNFLVISGKGYPDRLTLRFLMWISRSFPTSTIGFFDSDVYGLRICKSYQRCVRELIFGGVFLLETNIRDHLPITFRDIKIMINLLITLSEERNQENNSIFMLWKRELTRGLILFRKAEMNVLEFATDLNHYINVKSHQSQLEHKAKRIN
ncbi:Meiosis-specific protein SPO11 [Spathaspora sp. JA1]|nr:Meiosis-specific protein SPO11 [Spathaspora sp. JA1]